MSRMENELRSVVLSVACLEQPECKVSFEPEGSTHVLSTDDVLRVQISGPGGGDIDVAHLPDGLIIGAWRGAETRVWNKAGDELRT
jgi:hypothetical protein